MLGETLPRACIVPFGIAPAIVKADCARIRPNTEFVPPEFLVAVLNAEPTRKRVISLVKGIGRPRVNLANIRAITIPIPPLPEQHQILTQLDTALSACEAQETAIAHALKQAAAQRRNLLRASGPSAPRRAQPESRAGARKRRLYEPISRASGHRQQRHPGG
jgi:type I restriction enzyme S subunit